MHEFYLDLYNRTFILCVGLSEEALNKQLTEALGVTVELELDDCLGLTNIIKGREHTAIVIYLRHDDIREVRVMGTIVHESVHAANFVFSHCGIQADEDNDEPQAYLVDWIFRQIMSALSVK